MMCPVCKKTSKVGGVRKLLRGHYNPTTKRARHPNLQWFRLPSGKRIRVCTSCLKKQANDPVYFEKRGIIAKTRAVAR